ncbi:MAG TPA: hypothetical protein VGY55_15385 [Pirellulales bacterium]|jgi:hypothetical protein|nr:hypothetical protein [Pirellulales bacterium]
MALLLEHWPGRQGEQERFVRHEFTHQQFAERRIVRLGLVGAAQNEE